MLKSNSKIKHNGGTMKFGLVLIFLLVAFPMVSAIINSADITVEVKNVTKNINGNVTLNVKISSPDYSPSAANSLNITIVANKPTSSSKVIPFLFSGTPTTSNLDYYTLWNETDTQLTKCKIQRGQFETAYNKCLSDISVYTGANATVCKTKLETCSLDLKSKDLDLAAKDDQIATVKREGDATKNSKWMYGAGGIILGILGLLFYQGKLGGNAKERSMGEFNPSQAG